MKIVVALGGNALEWRETDAIERACEHIADLSKAGHELVVVHGNGPQVGNISLAFESIKDEIPLLPLDDLVAMSQGFIGYQIQKALRMALVKRNLDIPVASIVTQVVVDKNDPAFLNPSKPIGPYYDRIEASKLAKFKGYSMREEEGRGYRRVVPSPSPLRIVEIPQIKDLWDSAISIVCGGGGIPVVLDEDGNAHGVEAVVDKDLSAELLAEYREADLLLILTGVPNVYLNYTKAYKTPIDTLTVSEAQKYIIAGQFPSGSMLPKIQAAIKFVLNNRNKEAIITSLDEALDAVNGRSGTHILPSF